MVKLRTSGVRFGPASTAVSNDSAMDPRAKTNFMAIWNKKAEGLGFNGNYRRGVAQWGSAQDPKMTLTRSGSISGNMGRLVEKGNVPSSGKPYFAYVP